MTYATLVTGLQDPIAQWLKEEGHKVRKVMDGAILYDAKKHKPLPCFFNTFDVLYQEKGTVEQLMRTVLKKPVKFPRGRGSFRIVTSKENQLISVSSKLRNDVEKLISARTGLTPERRGGGREFWFLSRSEGITLFMERHPSPKEPQLKKGELRPQLAYCLNRLSNPKADDVMLDPFSGHGSIPKSRAEYFPCKEIHSMDREPGIEKLPSLFPPQSVDVIVTDPPWGAYNKEDDIPALYETFAKVSRQIIKPGGRVVVLSAQKELMRSHLEKGLWGSAKLIASYDILVSGQKAGVFLIQFV